MYCYRFHLSTICPDCPFPQLLRLSHTFSLQVCSDLPLLEGSGRRVGRTVTGNFFHFVTAEPKRTRWFSEFMTSVCPHKSYQWTKSSTYPTTAASPQNLTCRCSASASLSDSVRTSPAAPRCPMVTTFEVPGVTSCLIVSRFQHLTRLRP